MNYIISVVGTIALVAGIGYCMQHRTGHAILWVAGIIAFFIILGQ